MTSVKTGSLPAAGLATVAAAAPLLVRTGGAGLADSGRTCSGEALAAASKAQKAKANGLMAVLRDRSTR